MDKEKRLLWTEIVLKSYRLIPGWMHCMEAVRSTLIMYGLGNNHEYKGMSSEELFEKMIALNYRMHGLVNLKLLLEEGLKKVPRELAEVLSGKFIKNKDVNEMAEKMGVSDRTVYRMIKRGIEKLSNVFYTMGYNSEVFEKEYNEEPLLDIVQKGSVVSKS